MSVYTNFLKLRKPDETEKYTVNHFNANADLIDSALARMEQKNVSQDNLLASKASLAEHINNHSNPHNISKSQIGLDHVENKSSSDIRDEITESNVTTALGYTPCTPNEVDNKLASLKTEINSKQHTHNNKTVLDGITSALITAWNTVTNKVDKVAGKGLSSNDYTTEEKNKLNRIEPGANVNVQADWNVSDTTSDAYIKNKPNLAAYAPSVMTGATANAAGTSGIVPAPAKGKHRAYLRGDGTWQATSTSLTATTPGVPLDHTAAKTLKDQIDAQNSNLSELVGRFRYIPPFTAEKQTGIFNYILGFGLMLFIPYTFSYNEAILSNLRMFDEANTWNNVSGSFHGSVAAGGILFAIPTSSVEGMQFINHYSYGGQFSISIT